MEESHTTDVSGQQAYPRSNGLSDPRTLARSGRHTADAVPDGLNGRPAALNNVHKPRDFGGSASALDDRAVLITGATGSFGRTMVRKLLEESTVKRIAVLSRDEFKQYQMQQEIREAGHDVGRLRFFLGDVRDQSRLEMAMIGIDTVVHAAALKQVPAAEYNPFECIHTNVLGAENVVRAAIRTGVSKVVALSTDKASAPINLYGAS